MVKEQQKKELSARDFFRALLNDHMTAHKAVLDCSSMFDQELIVWMVILRAWEREAVWKIMQLDAALSSVEEAEKSKGHIYRLLQFQPRTSDALAALFILRQKLTGETELAPIRFIIWLNLELIRIAEEIERRAEHYPLGKKMIANVFIGAEFPHKELVQSVQQERMKWIPKARKKNSAGSDILKPYRPAIEDRQDREQEVTLACIKFQKRMEARPRLRLNPIEDEFYIPPLPRAAHLPRDRTAMLTRLNGIFALDDIEAMWQDILACLQGEMEKVPGKTYQDIRAEDEKWKAQKRKGETVSLDWELEGPCDQTIPKLDLKRLFEKATKRWGERGRLFLTALYEGKGIEEASRDAGVSRQTGHKYIKEIQNFLHPKKK